jgi:protein-disulfide isomerase
MDYECPACKYFEGVLRATRKAHEGDIAIVYRHFPLPRYKLAYKAARAVECAAMQGKFYEYHALLYQAPRLISVDWSSVASGVGVADSVVYAECVNAEGPVNSIEADIKLVQRLGGRGTPTILVNSKKLQFAPDSSGLERVIRRSR